MKKWLIFGVFYLIWQFAITGPELVEAKWWTNKSVDKSTSCYGSTCTTYRNEHKDNIPRYPYSYGYYAPSGPSWGPEVVFDFSCILGCRRDRVMNAQQPAPQPHVQAEPERVAAKPALPEVNIGRLANLRNHLDLAQASPRERIALERAILEISDRKKAEFSEDILRGDLVYLDRLLRKLKRANVKADEISALEDAIDYIETATSK